MSPSVTLETKCWENDWQFLLQTDRIRRMVEGNVLPFTRKTLIINNVRDVRRVCSRAEKLVSANLLTDFYAVRDHEKSALEFFQLSKESLGIAYVYSISELVGIYLCKTEFLLHHAGDSIPAHPTGWLDAALKRFDADPKVRVANLTWNDQYDEAARESFAEDEDFYTGYGFSGQMYLIRTSDFRSPEVYHERHPLSERYPAYGGELFEKRVDSWMRNHDYNRITYKHASYLHKNIPRRGARRTVQLLAERTKGLFQPD
jgi:hypothetical protein